MEVTRTQTWTTGEPEGSALEPLSPGNTIGRFVVLGTLGAGGMGVVLSAYDPVLERKVAIKQLRGERWAGAATWGRIRLMGEAQTLARLSHPHVVAVHEISFTDDGAFLVMEQISGSTLRGWLGERERPWTEILAMFLGAGEGLMAAHHAHIVHRDFKLDNVMVDRDGRARVVDFGVAAIVADEAKQSGRRALVGTLPYMAPEQLRGEPCDARADQFAYCVALWEALHGSRPFIGSTADELLAAINTGQLSDPSRKTPDWVRAALIRGLAANADERWPSLDVLLRVLRRDPRIVRRRLTAVAGLALVTGGLWVAWPSSASLDPCASAAARITGVWDAPRKFLVHTAFSATRLPYAEDTWRAVEGQLDHYTSAWGDMAGEACRATRIDGRQSDTLMDLRMACLDQRRAVLDALTALWAHGVDAETLEHAIDASGRLASLSECADARALRERATVPPMPSQLPGIAATRQHLDTVQALMLAHRWQDARKMAAAVRTEADATGRPELRAEAAFALGDVLSDLSDPGAEAVLVDAGRLAGAARDDRLAARALITLVGDIASNQQNATRALLVADVADGVIARTADDAFRIALLRNRALALLTAGKYEATSQALEAALTLATAAFGAKSPETRSIASVQVLLAVAQGKFTVARKVGEDNLAAAIARFGPDHPQVGNLLNTLASATSETDDKEATAEYLRRALAIRERTAGTESATTAVILNNLGGVELRRGHPDEAQRLLERALAIRVRTLGPEHPLVATTLVNLGDVRRIQGYHDEALDLLQRALAIDLKVYGTTHAKTALVLHKIGFVFENKGEEALALDYFQRALDARRKGLGPDHAMTLFSTMLVGNSLARLHRCAEARPLLAIAEPALIHAFHPEHPDVVSAITARSRCDLQDGHTAIALERLRRAVAIDEKIKTNPGTLGGHRALLAEALWAEGHRDEALVAAHKAEAELASAPGAATDPDLPSLRAWLAAHHAN
jgi:eukaryotic-like serine/threonine-protein kinase